MVVNRATGAIAHAHTGDLAGLLTPGDLVVVNDTRVFPARLHGRRVPSGGHVECLLLRRLDDERWDALVHPGQKLRPGRVVRFERGDVVLEAEMLDQRTFGRRTIRLWRPDGGRRRRRHRRDRRRAAAALHQASARARDRERYQTVYAQDPRLGRGADGGAAPRSRRLLAGVRRARHRARGHHAARRLRHVPADPGRRGRGPPHRSGALRNRRHGSRRDQRAHSTRGRRIVAVGTTTTRTLEARSGGARRPHRAGARRRGPVHPSRVRVPHRRRRCSPISTCRSRRC